MLRCFQICMGQDACALMLLAKNYFGYVGIGTYEPESDALITQPPSRHRFMYIYRKPCLLSSLK